MSITALFQPRFAYVLLRNIFLKLRYRNALRMNIFKTYLAPSASLVIRGNGQIHLSGEGKRIYISSGCEILASGGVLTIAEGVFFNRNCTVVTHASVSIGTHAMFGGNTSIFDSDHAFSRTDLPFSAQGYKTAPVSIGDNVWLGANTVVTKGTHIQRNTVVGANSVVRGMLEGDCVYAGNPLRKVRQIQANTSAA